MKVFQKLAACFVKDCPFSYVVSQRFLPQLRTKEYFENGKSSQWAAHVTEKEQELTPGVSHVLTQYLFSAKPVGAEIISVCFFIEEAQQRSGSWGRFCLLADPW